MSARQVVALGSAAVGALVAINGVLSPTTPKPKHAMPGETKRFDSAHGAIHYTVAGAGPPLVLVHGMGVAASSFEYRYVAEPLARSHTVYAPDLLGYGFSDHPKVAYSAALHTQVLAEFLREVAHQDAVLVTAGFSALYCAEIAERAPELVRALVISTPVHPDGRPELPRGMRQVADAILSTPFVGQSLFNAVTARNAIRAFMRDRAYSNPDLVTESMVDAQYAMARQPNARLAPHAFLAGRAGIDARTLLGRLRQPLLVIVGADSMRASQAVVSEYVRLAPRTQVRLIERSGLLPHEEQPEQFARAVTGWLSPS